jgi:hypothetical protein
MDVGAAYVGVMPGIHLAAVGSGRAPMFVPMAVGVAMSVGMILSEGVVVPVGMIVSGIRAHGAMAVPQPFGVRSGGPGFPGLPSFLNIPYGKAERPGRAIARARYLGVEAVMAAVSRTAAETLTK